MVPSGLFAVCLYLFLQCLERLEFYLVADFVLERDADVFAIELCFEIEQVDFQLHTFTIDSRATTDVRDARHITELLAVHGNRIYPMKWALRALQVDIRCREADGAAAFLAVVDSPADGIWPAQ